MSEEQEERIEIDLGNNGDFKESSEPVEIIKEEVTEVVESPNDETSLLSSIEDYAKEETDNLNRYNGKYMSR